ncbi:hypothetical protein H7K24_14085 [Mycobacterium fragae]|uniref:Uncharacterized protein n=1 Tax=Mycobacterium fragae TaxID=1260918 RepID=A0A1X1UIX9_9MYCO|nr:hypothetical protein [Mycobacterium fragae]MCV7401283.1 hypothetical protein [Mycobacterium fragae]ORV56793.1 hypothetical protein AWC06_00845 [Mycobacterium fragae]
MAMRYEQRIVRYREQRIVRYREQWIAHHREQSHEPYAAPIRENPERWECKCDPDVVWTAVWRILTPVQIRQKFAHLSKRRELQPDIAEIQAEQEQRNAALHKIDHSHIPPLRVDPRYVLGRPGVRRRR